MSENENICGGVTTAANWIRGDWMQTFTGRAFYPMDPQPGDIDPVDIAHALSLVCRYGGHVKRFYSVAEHCVLIANYLYETTGDRDLALWGLLHDAPEAYIGDMVRPLKRSMPAYREVDDKIMTVIAERFGLGAYVTTPDGFPIFGFIPLPVKDADNRILLTEKAALLSEPEIPWHPFFETITPLPVDVIGWDPEVAETEYLRLLAQFQADA